MTSTTLATFESSLEGVGVELVSTTADRFEQALEPHLDAPAVGSPLPFEDVSLPDTVDTDPTVEALDGA